VLPSGAKAEIIASMVPHCQNRWEQKSRESQGFWRCPNPCNSRL